MIFAWTKQFLVATGLFALVVTGQAVHLALKEHRLSEKQLELASRTVRVMTGTHFHAN